MRTREFFAGQVIFRENDFGETAYLIERGRVEILKNLSGHDVHLAYVERDQPFGEMSMIDEKPRSATAIALEQTVVREIHRDDLLTNMQAHPQISVTLLRVLFERLREADSTILNLYASHPELVPTQAGQARATAAPAEVAITLEGLTDEARNALPEPVVRVTKFPFRIGRQNADALTHNDLSLPDRAPFQISRNHLSFVQSGNRICLSDRGSTLGSMLDGKQVGGKGGQGTAIFLGSGEATLILGERTSPYKFKVRIATT